jgi:hypothetical protein
MPWILKQDRPWPWYVWRAFPALVANGAYHMTDSPGRALAFDTWAEADRFRSPSLDLHCVNQADETLSWAAAQHP